MSARPPLPTPPAERDASASRLQAVLAAQPDIVVLQDADDRYLEVHTRHPEMLVAPPAAFIGRTHRDFFPPELARTADALLATVRRTNELATAEYHVDYPAGRRWFEARSVPAGGGQVLTIVRDVTDRRATEDRLREQQRFLAALFDNCPLGIQVFAPDGTSVRMNEAKRRLLGLPSVDYGVGAYNILADPVVADGPVTAAFRAAVAGQPAEVVGLGADYSGPDCPWELDRPRQLTDNWMYAVPGPDDRPTAVVAFTQDVTERRRTEDLLRTVYDSAADGIVCVDDRGTILSTNPAAETIFGRPADDLVGTGVWTLVPALGDLEPGGGREVEGRRKDGLAFPLEMAVSAFRFDGRRHFTVTFRDLSDRKRLEDQLRQAQKLEAVGHLSAGVAHDFNNILTAVRGFADVLRHTLAAGHPAHDMADEIARAADRGAALTRQLLAFGRQEMVRVRVLDVNGVLADLARLLARLLGEDVALDARLSAVPQPVRADRGQLEQVIVNLAVNARDAMPCGGRLTLATDTVEPGETARGPSGASPGRYVRVSVSDTGTGMTDEVRARLFEPFFTTKEVGKGTGLGLATVYGIVRQTGGFLTVTSQPGKGSRFDVYLPLADDAAAAGPRSGLQRLPMTAGNETVLVVEDDDAVRALTTFVLSAAGYTVHTAADGPAALTACDGLAGELDLVVTDVVMPGMGGRELAERLAGRYPRLKVVFLSGYTADTVLRHGVAEDRVAFLQKPFSPDKLTAFVRDVLDRGERPA